MQQGYNCPGGAVFRIANRGLVGACRAARAGIEKGVMLTKILVANSGEIAVPVLLGKRGLRAMAGEEPMRVEGVA